VAAQRKRRSRRSPPAPPPPASPAAPVWRRPEVALGILVFAGALVLRVLFITALPDRAWPHGVFLKGDAPLWVEYARDLLAGRPFELDLPIHPPGAAYLLAAIWDGRDPGIAMLKVFWGVLGAAVALLACVAAVRSFGVAAGAIVGAATAASTGMLILSGSLDSETPYLVLAIGSLCLFEDVRAGPRLGLVAAWSALHGLCCLFRVEHALFYALVLVLVAALWWRAAAAGRTRRRAVALALAVSASSFALPLVPWHVAAWSSVRRFNTEPPAADDPGQQAVRRVAVGLSWMPWDEAARAERERLPAFAREAASTFVAATVLHRGGDQVRAPDLRILDEGFAYRPRPLARAPFVSLYGPLNFALANHPRARGGFSRAALDDLPPLASDPARYPPFLVQGLPPPDLSFVYPPHVRLVNEGYAVGWTWLRARGAGGALAHAWRKLRIFWSGAALGLTGYDLPLGLPRLRRAVDLAVPAPGWRTAAWSTVLLIGCALGLAAGRRQPALQAWLFFLVSKVLVTVAFFGYARQGAAIFPVVALLVALALVRRVPACNRARPGQVVRATALALAALVAVEAARALRPPALSVDGRPLEAGDATDLHRDQAIEAR
jgi:hypothetical protein